VLHQRIAHERLLEKRIEAVRAYWDRAVAGIESIVFTLHQVLEDAGSKPVFRPQPTESSGQHKGVVVCRGRE